MSPSDLIILLISPFMGSFIGCLADRLPAARPMLWARSSCDHCSHVLGPFDLVPVVSWLLSSGKCRYCGAKISLRYPLVELAAIGTSLAAILVADGALAWITVGFGWLLLALAVMDLRHMFLADSLTAALLLSGLAAAWIWSVHPMQDHVLGAVLGAGFLFVVNAAYRTLRGVDGLGLGDVKLAAGAGAWLGWQGLPSVLVYATASALLIVASGLFGRELARDKAVPFGAFICLGIWITWLAGPILFDVGWPV